VIDGGRTLQPVLYALVVEKLFPGLRSTRALYYCTSAGGFAEREVALNDAARAARAAGDARRCGARSTSRSCPRRPTEGRAAGATIRRCAALRGAARARKYQPRIAALKKLRDCP
jgi:hypothetical protein